MAASMNSVTMRGFGNGAFVGDINLVVTLGYGSYLGVIVSGPYCVAAGGWWIPGGEDGQNYIPGMVEGGAYIPGGRSGQAYIPGASAGDAYIPGATKGQAT